jgi:hypothetical protein
VLLLLDHLLNNVFICCYVILKAMKCSLGLAIFNVVNGVRKLLP